MLDEQDIISVLQQLNNFLNTLREYDVNLTVAVSILSLAVMNFGNQTVEQPISEVHRRKDVSVDIYFTTSSHTHIYTHTHIICTHHITHTH